MLKTLRGRLTASYVAVVLAALVLATVAYFALGVRYRTDDAYRQLATSMYLVAPQVEDALGPGLGVLDRARVLGATEHIRGELRNTRFRLLLLRPDGRVVLDSLTGRGNMTGRLMDDLPAALISGPVPTEPVEGLLRADAAGTAWIYVAAPPRAVIGNGAAGAAAGNPRFYMLLAAQRPGFADVVQSYSSRFLLVGLLAVVVSLVVGGLLARSITRPLGTLAAASHAIAGGDYGHQAPVTGSVEMRALAADFNYMAGQVQRAQQAQRDFLANISHDLKTPLTSIQGFSQAMLDGTIRERAAFLAAAQVINAESQRMARLVADLVDLVRLQSGAATVEKTPVDVGRLLEQAATGMQPQATDRHVELRVQAPALPPIPADADRLRRAITNLLDNALRHTPPEGRVTLSAESLPGAVRISVQDTGEGIPESDLPRVFERFYQVDKSRTRADHGSGLGLAIVREVVAAHGGDVRVQSRPGAGSEFAITLPTTGALPPRPAPAVPGRSVD
jgi:signal transduction histidine kinase